jgi:hypothetical protein
MLRLFIAHLRFVARSVELSNDDNAESRQGLLTLLVRQPIPELIETQRARWARGGATVAARCDMGHLLGPTGVCLESIPRAGKGQPARLWGRLPISVKAKEGG